LSFHHEAITLRPTLEWKALAVGLALIAGCSSPPAGAIASVTEESGATDDASLVSDALDAAILDERSHAPVDSTKKLDSLSDDEWAKICDWEAERMGGYGHTVMCEGNFTPMAPTDQATCVRIVRIKYPCDLLVSDFERCIDERVDDPCALVYPTCESIGICHDPPDARPDK
jgi:hypothetical protein